MSPPRAEPPRQIDLRCVGPAAKQDVAGLVAGRVDARLSASANAPAYVCPHPGLAVQRIGQSEDVVAPGYFAGPPSFTPAVKPDSCIGHAPGALRGTRLRGVTPTAPPSTAIRHPQWDCRGSCSRCWGHIIGAAPRHTDGSRSPSRATPAISDLICCQGGYQKAGVSYLVAPSVCIDSEFAGFDAS